MDGNITVTVVTAGGNLLVRGEKQININQGGSTWLQGIIRPSTSAPRTRWVDEGLDARSPQRQGRFADARSPAGFRFFNSPWFLLNGTGAPPSHFSGAAALVARSLCCPRGAHAERIRHATVAGVRGNQLVGYGLVVGLAGTGDQTSQTPFTIQSIKNMLAQLGILVPDNVNPQLRNVAAVTVQATLPPFSKPGQTIDVTVSSIGNAQSLRGGSLIMAPLRGADGNVYAMAQGNLVVGGFGVQGDDGSKVTVNVPSTGRVPNGATVERTVPSTLGTVDALVLNLNTPDFTTAARLADAINASVGGGVATTIDRSDPRGLADDAQRVAYISHLGRRWSRRRGRRSSTRVPAPW